MTNTEYLDVFDDNMKFQKRASREEIHRDGLWHQTFHCWIVKQCEGKQFILFQRRSSNKVMYPNFLDISVAGHLQAGEMPLNGIREINEELGLSVTENDLVPLGIRTDVAQIGNIINREFCHTYLLESNIPLCDYRLQLHEVSSLVEMEIEEGLRFFSGETEFVRVIGYEISDEGKMRKVDIEVSLTDFIPQTDRLYLKILIMAQRYFEHRDHLAI
jgi:isopentenyldiphosphate isomerase